jgi:hypothetical protein
MCAPTEFKIEYGADFFDVSERNQLSNHEGIILTKAENLFMRKYPQGKAPKNGRSRQSTRSSFGVDFFFTRVV